jgi:hypothetical protein
MGRGLNPSTSLVMNQRLGKRLRPSEGSIKGDQYVVFTVLQPASDHLGGRLNLAAKGSVLNLDALATHKAESQADLGLHRSAIDTDDFRYESSFSHQCSNEKAAMTAERCIHGLGGTTLRPHIGRRMTGRPRQYEVLRRDVPIAFAARAHPFRWACARETCL